MPPLRLDRRAHVIEPILVDELDPLRFVGVAIFLGNRDRLLVEVDRHDPPRLPRTDAASAKPPDSNKYRGRPDFATYRERSSRLSRWSRKAPVLWESRNRRGIAAPLGELGGAGRFPTIRAPIEPLGPLHLFADPHDHAPQRISPGAPPRRGRAAGTSQGMDLDHGDIAVDIHDEAGEIVSSLFTAR